MLVLLIQMNERKKKQAIRILKNREKEGWKNEDHQD